MGLISTNLQAIINNYSSPISYSDTESKGVNLSSVGSGQIGNPQGPPVPYWYAPTNINFSKHHMTISCSGHFTYYIWQYQSDVRYSTSVPAHYGDGNTLTPEGGQFIIIINSNGSISAQAIPSSFGVTAIAKAAAYYASNLSFINGVSSALASFATTSLGISTIAAIAKGLTGTTPNYAQQVLDSPQLSYLKNNISSVASSVADSSSQSFNVFSVGNTTTASSIVGVSRSQDLYSFPQNSESSLVNNTSFLVGVSEGLDTSITVGLWNIDQSDLGGLALGATMSFVMGVGIDLNVFFDNNINVIGFSVGISTGESFGFTSSIGWSTVVA